MGTLCKIGCGLVLMLAANLAVAVAYYEDDRSMNSDVPGLPHYRSPEEACITGVLERRVQGYQENDNRQYRYRSANVGTDDGFAEFACQGVIERRFYYSGVNWVTVEVVAALVYGPFGASETCTLAGYQDPETGQCGPPKCTDQCCGSGCGNGSNPIQTASGNKHQVETDYVGTGPFPLLFSRTYDSQRAWLNVSPPMGVGWTHRYLAHQRSERGGHVSARRAYSAVQFERQRLGRRRGCVGTLERDVERRRLCQCHLHDER
jgi:hypothetical protein